MMFADVANEWADKHFNIVTYGTAKSYKAPLNRSIDYFYEYDISSITPVMIQDFLYCLVAKEFSSKTVRNHFLVINMIFNYAILCQHISVSPCLPVKVPRNLPRTKRRVPTPQEIEIVKNSISCEFGLFAYFILYTGLRKGEAIALQYKDIDLDNNVIHVTKASYYRSNQAIIKKPKTDSGFRDVFLLDALKEKLNMGAPNHYIFSNSEEPITAKKFMVMWHKYLIETGLNITPHQLRHAYATMLYDCGLDMKDSQYLLGHSSISVTMDVYTHISKSRQLKSYNSLNDFCK